MDKAEELAKRLFSGLTLGHNKVTVTNAAKEIYEYAQQVNQEIALEFAAWILKKVDVTLSDFLDESWFKEWQKQK